MASNSIINVQGAVMTASNGTLTDLSGTIAVANTAQQLAPALSSRQGWRIQNTSNSDLYVNDFGTATTSSYRVAAGAEYNPPAVNGSAISILGTQAGQTFVASQWQMPTTAGATLFVEGATPNGQGLASASYGVVPASNYTESATREYIVNIAITGAAIGERVLQTIKNNGGTVSSTWFNLNQGTIITTPNSATILSSLGASDGVIPANWKAAKKWYITPSGLISSGTAWGNTVETFCIRNTNAFPVRVISCEFSSRTTVNTAGVNVQNIPYDVRMFIGTTSYTTGTALNVVNGKTYASDNTITASFMPTSLNGTSVINVGDGSVCIMQYQASNTSPTFGENRPEWIKGMIIPAGGMLAFRGRPGFGSPTSTVYCDFTCVLTDEL